MAQLNEQACVPFVILFVIVCQKLWFSFTGESQNYILQLQMNLAEMLVFLIYFFLTRTRLRQSAPVFAQLFFVIRVVAVNLSLRNMMPFGTYDAEKATLFYMPIINGFLGIVALCPLHYLVVLFFNGPLFTVGYLLQNSEIVDKQNQT